MRAGRQRGHALAPQIVQAGVSQATTDGKVRPLRQAPVLVGHQDGERAPWLEPYGGGSQWRRQMWDQIGALHGRYPVQLGALKEKWWTDESPLLHRGGSTAPLTAAACKLSGRNQPASQRLSESKYTNFVVVRLERGEKIISSAVAYPRCAQEPKETD
jgi:hypothetical protein